MATWVDRQRVVALASVERPGGAPVSVIMMLRAKADPNKIEQGAQANPDAIRAIVEKSKTYGVIAHRFYGSDDGHVMVLDEWPDPESFQRFFEATRNEIGPMMAA